MLKFFLCLPFLFSLGRCTEEAQIIEEGLIVPIDCDLKQPSTVLWFRIGNTGMDVLGFINSKDEVKYNKTHFKIESKGQMKIEGFNKERDSGVYGCSTIVGRDLTFGKTTTLQGPAEQIISTSRPVTTAAPPSTTRTPCQCKTEKRSESLGSCEVAILAPLVVGSILLFLILILTIRHCSRIRTRGCPHHYKRRPRNPARANFGKPERYT